MHSVTKVGSFVRAARPHRVRMMRRRRVGLVCVLYGLVASCSPPPDEVAIRQELLSADPAFTAVLQKRDEQAARIKLLERELSLKQSHVNRRIKNLRAELTEARSQVKQKREAI